MNQTGNLTPPGNKKSSSNSTNPFARALAESEKGAYAKKGQADQLNANNDLGSFGEALAKTGGKVIPDQLAQQSPEDLLAQQEKLKEEQKKKELRKKLHDQVNPVDQAEVFSATRERTKKELQEVRKELKKLALEISKFYKEVDIAVTQDVVDPGMGGGIGIKSYFQKLRAFIILLTQKVKSARTWMKQQQAKSAKKKQRKVRGGIDAGGAGKSQEAKAVFDMMYHERSNAYSGA